MLDIESFWKGIKPFNKPMKGYRGHINYGCYTYGKDRPGRCEKRKAYRQIRKYGFDMSETWSLDCTIMAWLSDTFGGFFTICGESDNWGEVDLEGNSYDFWKHRNDSDWCEKSRLYEKTRYDSFYAHLKDLLDNVSQEDMEKISNFCVPRLRRLADVVHGWPCDDTFKNFEEWRNCINEMADKFEHGTYSSYFITYFFSLWD